MSKCNHCRRSIIINVSTSSTTIVNAVCKHCGKPATVYYRMASKKKVLDPNIFIGFFKWLKKQKRLCCQDYMMEAVSFFDGMSVFTYNPVFKSFNPALHKSRGIPIFSSDDYIDCIICPCGMTSWTYYYNAAINRPDVVQRKSKDFVPKIFYY